MLSFKISMPILVWVYATTFKSSIVSGTGHRY